MMYCQGDFRLRLVSENKLQIKQEIWNDYEQTSKGSSNSHVKLEPEDVKMELGEEMDDYLSELPLSCELEISPHEEVNIDNSLSDESFHIGDRNNENSEIEFVDGENKYYCNQCNRNFTRKKQLASHIKVIHNKMNKFISVKSFHVADRNNESLTEHFEIQPVNIKNKYHCNQCNRSFTRKNRLASHVQVVHKKIKKFTCCDCNRGFSRKAAMMRHIEAIHSVLTTLECKFCFQVFIQKTHLANHIDSVHKGIKKYQCSECPCAFAKKMNWRKHIDRIHQNLEKYKCKECNSAFSQTILLKNHYDFAHRNVATFPCDECDRAFTRKSRLKAHIDFTHKNIVKFICKECRRSFTRAPYLKNHIESVHLNIKKFSCDDCGRPFSRNEDLKNHIRVVHEKLLLNLGQISTFPEDADENGLYGL